MTAGNPEGGRKAMENLLAEGPRHHGGLHHQRAGGGGRLEALKAVGKEKDVTIVSVDGGCPGVKNVKDGVIGATSMQFPLLMASKGVEAVKTFVAVAKSPSRRRGSNSSTPVWNSSPTSRWPALTSIDSAAALKKCWG